MIQNFNALPDLSRPLVIFKIGILGCMPLDAPEKIADEYTAFYASSESIRQKLILDNLDKGIVKNANYYRRPERCNDKLLQIVEPILKDGDDVIIDKFYNTVNRRNQPIELARTVGALTVALLVHAPDKIINQRVNEWVSKDEFPTPVAKWEVHPMTRVHNMRRHLEKPCHEDIDYVFRIDGNTDSDGILEQFDRCIEFHNLDK